MYYMQMIGTGKGTIVRLQQDLGNKVSIVVIEQEGDKYYSIFPYLIYKPEFEKYYKPLLTKKVSDLKKYFRQQKLFKREVFINSLKRIYYFIK